jgi:hypothetical protein
MPHRITREERITFYRMIIQQSGLTLRHDTDRIDHMMHIIHFLHTNIIYRRDFMRFTHVKGQSNSFYVRVLRMILTLTEG